MIWLATLFLLIVTCYLVVQGLAERKSYHDNIDEEGVDETDEGLFMQINDRLTGDPNRESKFSKVVQTVQEKSAQREDKFEQKIQSKIAKNDSLFERSLGKVSEINQKADEKLSKKIEANTTQPVGQSITDDETPLARTIAKVSSTLDKTDEKLQAKINKVADQPPGKFTEEEGFFAKLVGNVSTKLESFDERIDDKLNTARAASGNESLSDQKDVFSRIASKVGHSVNKADDKLVDASRKLAGKSD